MKKIAWFTALGLAFCMVAFAGTKVAALDGTSWKIDVSPDAMAKAKGEKDYKEVLTFVDGMVSMTEGQKVGFASARYEVTKSDKGWTFKSEQKSDSTGQSIWTGTTHEGDIEGKLIVTQKGGAVLTYTFKGDIQD